MMLMLAAGRKSQPNSSGSSSSSSGNSNGFCGGAGNTSLAATKSSNSSSETVIAQPKPQSDDDRMSEQPNGRVADQLAAQAADCAHEQQVASDANHLSASDTMSPRDEQPADSRTNSSGRLKNLLVLANTLNPFHSNHRAKSANCSESPPTPQDTRRPNGQLSGADHHSHSKHKSLLNLLAMAQKYFARQSCDLQRPRASDATHEFASKSAPVTPVKWAQLDDSHARLANGLDARRHSTDNDDLAACDQPPSVASLEQSRAANGQPKPSVRFDVGSLESRGSKGSAAKTPARLKFADCAVQTNSADSADHEASRLEEQSADLVARLFKVPDLSSAGAAEGETPMDSKRFQQYGYKLIDYISNYLDTIRERRVTPLNIEPGYLKSLIQADAPEKGDSFANIMRDFESHIMCGITHWQHPHFHAYFPAGNAYPSILADVLSDALGCVGFSWAASPAYTELEIIMLDWMGKMIGLPDEFLCLSGSRSGGQESKGGGVIQGSASECVLVNLLAARHWAIERLRRKYPDTPDGMLLSRLIGYCSKEAHSCVEKAAMIGFIRMRALDTDEHHSLRGATLRQAMEADMENGLEPFIVCATLGTTSCVSFDNLEELGKICQQHDVWLHVDAAYAGSALICPEFKYLMRGIEMASSFNMNPNKWMLINFDCSLMWVKDRFKLTRAFVVDPLYLQHSFSDQAIDYRHWGIPLSRRFRALKLWFVIRNYGVEGLRAYIRNHVRLAKLFESYIKQDARFVTTNQVVLGLVCFRLVGSNALNQRLLSMINASGKLHMVPASLNGRYVIRFCVCDQHAQDADILYAYRCISDFATELFDSIRAGRERIRAISQQNTFDVSSISLHTQQSASADRLAGDGQQGGEQQSRPSEQDAQQVAAGCSRAETRRQYLISRRYSRGVSSSMGQHELEAGAQTQPVTPLSPLSGARSPLIKQVSVQPQQQVTAGNSSSHNMTNQADDEDLEQEIVLDSLATLDGCDYELDYEVDEDDLLEPPLSDELDSAPDAQSAELRSARGQPMDVAESRSPVARRWHSRAGRASRTQTVAGSRGEQDPEAEDEVFTLAERRNRMSLRYKREFFVRVVSDPRVYRASISGDINAHASCCSLGGAAKAGRGGGSQCAEGPSGGGAPEANPQTQVA